MTAEQQENQRSRREIERFVQDLPPREDYECVAGILALARCLTLDSNATLPAFILLPFPDRLFELLVAGFGIAPDSVQAVMPEVISHQRQVVTRLVVEPRPARVPQGMNPLNFTLAARQVASSRL